MMKCTCELRPAGKASRTDDLIRFKIKLVKCPLCEAAPDLLEACKQLVKHCGCTIRERESGHRIDCFVTAELTAIIARTEKKR